MLDLIKMRFLGQILCQKCIQPLKCDVLSIPWMSQIPCLQTFKRRISISSETNSLQNGRIQVSEEVSQALSDSKPVVALESTIITHGMPYPHNLQTALEVEDTVRDNGCIPATIGVIAGQVHVGLDQTNMERLGSATKDLVKISRRDLAYAVSKKLSGGTTVSSTMLIAHQVGIDVFATGGIGGVHRGAQHTMDISADLTELGRTPVAVVSAGVKSILDIEKTLEYLETQGVCVATFGKDKDFPAFFTPSSGLRAPFNVDNEIQAAELIYASQYELKLRNGILIGVPIPETFAEAGEEIEEAIQIVIKESREKKVVGKEVTPYILKRVHELTHGESLQANMALIKNNAMVGSKVAWQLNKLINKNKNVPDTTGRSHVIRKNNSSSAKKNRPVVIGGTVVDFNARMKHPDIQSHGSTNPGSIQQSFGGVGRNLADCLSRLGAQPLFISAVGDDSHADSFISHCQHMDLRGVQRLKNNSTATYCAVLGLCGQLQLGIGDMEIHKQITPKMICEYEDDIKEAAMVILDGNISTVAIETACDISSQYNVPVFFEPTDILKASNVFETEAYKKVMYTSPNINELQIMSGALLDSPKSSADLYSIEDHCLDDVINFCLPHGLRLAETVPVVLVTLGKHGVMLYQQGKDDIQVKHYPAPQLDKNLVSVSGAGDCFTSAFINGVIQGLDIDRSIRVGLDAAKLSLLSREAVPKTITPDIFSQSRIKSLSALNPKIIRSDFQKNPQPLKPLSAKI